MDFPPVLVSASDAILYVDLSHGTYRNFLPYPGNLDSTSDHLVVLRGHNERSRLDLYDCQGTVWMRRLPDCFDAHSIVLLGDDPSCGFAACSTGTNEIIYLDGDGRELRRWSPDPAAEFDSWHINSLTVADGRLHATCFGRFARFRGWSGYVPNSGMILDVERRHAVVEGLSAPHDPCRLEGGWLVNDSDRSRMLFVPDRGAPKVVVEAPGFSRGLAVLPEHLVVGFSSPRERNRAGGNAAILVIDRDSYRVVKTIVIPFAEIGWICAAPRPEVVAAIDREQHMVPEHFGLHLMRGVVAAEERAGAVEVLDTPRREPGGGWTVRVRVSNRGPRKWSSCNEPPVRLAYQALQRDGAVVLADGERTNLPLPVYPGQQLTFSMHLHIPSYALLPTAGWLRFTLVQETVAWWEETAAWKPATIPLPRL